MKTTGVPVMIGDSAWRLSDELAARFLANTAPALTGRAEMTVEDADAILRAEMKRERKKLERRVSLPPRAKARLVACFEAAWAREVGLDA